MKKYLILAAVALVASAACSKVETDENIPAKKITFEAASYVPQTKANTSVWDEFTSFKCKAFLHAAGYADVQNMFGATGETISPYKTDGTAATGEANVSYWAPSHDYYWPKDASSYVNFVAWYDKKGTAPTTATETSLSWANYTVLTTDNLLYADEAWHYKQNTTNAAQYTGDAVTSGVPMLFHHALAQLCIKASVTQATDGKTPAHTWDVTLSDISLAGVYNHGTLTLTNSDPANDEPAVTGATTKAWSGSWATTGDPTSVAMADVTTPLTTTAVDVLTMQNVLPQTVTDVVVLNLKYNISYKYNGTEYAHEKITAAIQLNSITDAISSWGMNKKITYTISINPVTTTIKIDPAVVEWEAQAGGSTTL